MVPFNKIKKKWPILWLLLGLITLGCLIASALWPNQAGWHQIKDSFSEKQNRVQAMPFSFLQEAKEPSQQSQGINFLLLGAAGEGHDAPDLTDTIIAAHWNERQKKVYLFSLPRDLAVRVDKRDYYIKINALYALNKKNPGHEFELIKNKAEQITGLEIHYYLFADLTVVKNLVDILAGVNVMVKKDIQDERFPGPNHGFERFELKSGWRYLDGKTALKYIRSRASAGGDFDRIQRQQEILQALKQKVLALNFWDLPSFFRLFTAFSTHFKTNLSLWQLYDFWQKLKDLPGENIVRSEISQENLLTGDQAQLGGQLGSVLKPKAGLENYEEIKKYITAVINEITYH